MTTVIYVVFFGQMLTMSVAGMAVPRASDVHRVLAAVALVWAIIWFGAMVIVSIIAATSEASSWAPFLTIVAFTANGVVFWLATRNLKNKSS